MSEDLRIVDPKSFPIYEGKLPKPIYHCGLLSDPKITKGFNTRGWSPVDLRLEESGPETLKHWLEGIRFGTIEADRQTERFVELELKVYGLLQVKKPSDLLKPVIEEQTLDDLFGALPSRYTKAKKTKGKVK